MSLGVLVLHLTGYFWIAALPQIFFKKGRFTPMWFVTSSPIAAPALVLLLTKLGYLRSFVDPTSTLGEALQGVSAFMVAGAIGLIFFTMGTHRIPLALYHQPNDPPEQIVTWGPYGRIRHPFYASFLLQVLAAIVVSPQIATVLCFVAALVLFTHTARREEKRLLASKFGAEYAAYVARTGRFFPRLGTAR